MAPTISFEQIPTSMLPTIKALRSNKGYEIFLGYCFGGEEYKTCIYVVYFNLKCIAKHFNTHNYIETTKST